MLLHCWWECKLIQPLWKTVRTVLKNLGIKPPHDPAIPVLGTYPEGTKTERDKCIPLFTAALFTIVRTGKQPRSSLTDEWIKKLWCTHTMVSQVAQWLRICPPVQEMEETWVRSLGREDPLEEEMATYSSILACESP